MKPDLIHIPLKKAELRRMLKDNDIEVKRKKIFCTHTVYKTLVFHYPESKKYFIFQLELDL